MIWLPAKSPFRDGTVDNNNWNADSIGSWSFASGFSIKAKATGSTAMGNFTTASGSYATSMGLSTTASGEYSTTMGVSNVSKVYTSLSIRTPCLSQFNLRVF